MDTEVIDHTDTAEGRHLIAHDLMRLSKQLGPSLPGHKKDEVIPHDLAVCANTLRDLVNQGMQTEYFIEHNEHGNNINAVTEKTSLSWLLQKDIPSPLHAAGLEAYMKTYNRNNVTDGEVIHSSGLFQRLNETFEAREMMVNVETLRGHNAALPTVNAASVDAVKETTKAKKDALSRQERGQHNREVTLKMLEVLDTWHAQMKHASTSDMIHAFAENHPAVKIGYYKNVVRNFPASGATNLKYQFWDGVIAAGKAWNDEHPQKSQVDVNALSELDASLISVRPNPQHHSR